jgi:hypothetical protein
VGEVVRKKQSEGERRWELGESAGREDGGGGRGEEKGGGCGLAVAPGAKRTAANMIAVARFWERCYC